MKNMQIVKKLIYTRGNLVKMNINILSKNQVKKLIIEETGKEFRKIEAYLNKLNERLMRLEEEFKCRRRFMEKK